MRSRPRLKLSWKREILEEQRLKCTGCGRTITLDAYRLRDWKKILGHYPDESVPSKAYFHHKELVAFGGENDPSNLVALCGRCHRAAHPSGAKYRGTYRRKVT
jgi:5-methylcytosine-specific restriction endonuclease McrA